MINFGPGAVLRTKKFKHQFSLDAGEWVELAHPDKKTVAVCMLLGFEKLDQSGPTIDVNEVLTSFGWVSPSAAALLPIGTEVDYSLETDCGGEISNTTFLRATVSAHVEGWYELTFLSDGSKATVRPSRVFHESQM